MDKIKIQGLEIFAHHGVFSEENVLGQKFVISATLFVDTRKVGKTDCLEESIHYGLVSQDIKSWVEENTYQMIEKVAEEICERLLLKYEKLRAIELEVKKPWAPVLLPLDFVSVTIYRKWNHAFIALGSNLGDRKQYLDMAVEQLRERADIKVIDVAPYLETKPYGEYAKYEFLNSCVEIETLLTPEELLKVCNDIEEKGQRERKIHWGPTTLDLDILFYNEEIISTKQLIIPHPEIEKRKFVLQPMCDIAPYFRHPIHKKTMKQLLEDILKEEKDESLTT